MSLQHPERPNCMERERQKEAALSAAGYSVSWSIPRGRRRNPEEEEEFGPHRLPLPLRSFLTSRDLLLLLRRSRNERCRRWRRRRRRRCSRCSRSSCFEYHVGKKEGKVEDESSTSSSLSSTPSPLVISCRQNSEPAPGRTSLLRSIFQ